MTMTDHNNSNDHDDRLLNTPSEDSGSHHDVPNTSSDDWDAFVQEHAGDLSDVEHSRAGRRFERHAEQQEKKALLSVDDLKRRAFVSGNRHGMPGGGSAPHAGPRDHTSSSWLDTDDVMDQADPFTPPNPDLGPTNPTKIALWAIFLIGVAGILLTVFITAIPALLTGVFAVCALIGGAGLLVTHRGHDETKDGPDDTGARV